MPAGLVHPDYSSMRVIGEFPASTSKSSEGRSGGSENGNDGSPEKDLHHDTVSFLRGEGLMKGMLTGYDVLPGGRGVELAVRVNLYDREAGRESDPVSSYCAVIYEGGRIARVYEDVGYKPS